MPVQDFLALPDAFPEPSLLFRRGPEKRRGDSFAAHGEKT